MLKLIIDSYGLSNHKINVGYMYNVSVWNLLYGHALMLVHYNGNIYAVHVGYVL